MDTGTGRQDISGLTGLVGKPVGSEQRLRTIPVPVEMEKEPYGNGGEEEIAIGGNKK